MAIQPESKFIQRIHRRLPRELYKQRVSSAAMNGTPDWWYSAVIDAWIEYKWLSSLPASGVDPLKLLSALQALWINRRYKEGRNVGVIIGSPTHCVVLTNGSWNSQVPFECFNYSEADVANWITSALYASTSFSS